MALFTSHQNAALDLDDPNRILNVFLNGLDVTDVCRAVDIAAGYVVLQEKRNGELFIRDGRVAELPHRGHIRVIRNRTKGSKRE